jgi:hypothetical protein
VLQTPQSPADTPWVATQTSCPLYPQKRTCAVHQAMSALGQKQTSQALFDHLVGKFQERVGPGTDRALHHVITKKRNFRKLVIWRIVKVVRSD